MSVRSVYQTSALDDRRSMDRFKQILNLGFETGPSADKRPRESGDSSDDHKRTQKPVRFGFIDKFTSIFVESYSVDETGTRDDSLLTRAELITLLEGDRWTEVCNWVTGRNQIDDDISDDNQQVIYLLDRDGNLIAVATVNFPSFDLFKKNVGAVIDEFEKQSSDHDRELYALLKDNRLLFEFDVVCTAGSTRGKFDQSEHCVAGASSWMIYCVVQFVYNYYVKPLLAIVSFEKSEIQVLRMCMLKLDSLSTALEGWEKLGFQQRDHSRAPIWRSRLHEDMFRIMFPGGNQPQQPRDLRACPENPMALTNATIRYAVDYVLIQGGDDYDHPKYGPISTWDVSNVTDMSGLFLNATRFNGDVSKWTFPNVFTMHYMFNGAKRFNGDVSKWTFPNVTDMSYMFENATSFEGKGVSKWTFPNVTDMSYMFENATSFEGKGVSKWTFPNVTTMHSMFYGATSFAGDVSEWKFPNVFAMHYMFNGATSFNGDVSTWTFPKVEDMSYMFNGATSFDGKFSSEAIADLRSRGVELPKEAV